MELLHGALGSDDHPAMEIALGHALLRRVSQDASEPVLRVYRPTSAVVAFGRRDALTPGFPRAVRVAREAGFTPVIRPQGGRAVAYTENALVVDHVAHDPTLPRGIDERFTSYGELWAEVLREHDVSAWVGAVPGEYCPGAFSVNARGVVKLVGTAQRLVRRAWLFSAVAILDDADLIRPVLTEIYRHLGLPFDATSVGSVRAEQPAITLDVLEASVIAAYDRRFGLSAASMDDAVLTHARDLLNDHRID